jgi:hypothetical protein
VDRWRRLIAFANTQVFINVFTDVSMHGKLRGQPSGWPFA